MQQHFLCPTHRQWLMDNHLAALNHFNSCIDTAQFYADNGCWNVAIPYYGCAFETAEILLSEPREQHPQSLLKFTHSAISLANAFFRTDRGAEHQRTFELAKARLQAEIEIMPIESPHQPLLLDCYAALDMGLQNSAIFLSEDNMEQSNVKKTRSALH
ncbi:hypothetical protein QX776_12430 [Alteromonadaceae bacterium BrNp21-10]|nr:hypothetical protein [Alteromonadaceae bacterium BrNp21-10]